MTPSAAIALDNWQRIQEKLQGLREEVYRAMLKAGPQTTLGIAAASNLSLLTVRPRVTELCELGLAEFAGRLGREGIYRAIPLAQVRRNIQQAARDARESAAACQLQLL
jgi:predicted transcriptional regulator